MNESVKISEIFGNILENLEKENDENVSVGEIARNLGSRTFGPMILVPGLLAAFPPIGGIPGMSIITGIWIVLIAVQLLFFQKHLWLPKHLKQAEFDRESFKVKAQKLIKRVKKVESIFKSRWNSLTNFPFVQVIALECIILAITMFPLALVPFGVTLPAITIIFFAIGLTMKDGFMVILGHLCFIGSLVLTYYLSSEIKSFF